MNRNDPTDRLLQLASRYAPLLRLGCLWGAVLVVAVLLRGAFFDGGRGADFRLFYEALERARRGLPMYGALVTDGRQWMAGPNFNPPHFYVLVAPFALLPFAASFVTWTLAGLLAGVFVAGRAVRSLKVALHPQGLLLAAGLILANASLASTLRVGQMSLFLSLPAGLAWIAAREGRWTLAGLYLGVAASVKPFMLIFLPYLVLTRRWRASAAMMAAALFSIILGAAAFGLENLRGWLATFESSRMDRHFYNASFPGFAVRMLDVEGGLVGPATAAAGALVTLAFAVRSSDTDRVWLLLVGGALLWSPLGWIYYGWLLMPPIVALAVRGRLPAIVWGWVLFWLWPPYTPGLANAAPPVALTAGSVYFWGLLLAWVGALVHLDHAPQKSGRGQT